jgi:uncharacterized coiled-coil protein SlyX
VKLPSSDIGSETSNDDEKLRHLENRIEALEEKIDNQSQVRNGDDGGNKSSRATHVEPEERRRRQRDVDIDELLSKLESLERMKSKMEELEERLHGIEKREYYSTDTEELEERLNTLSTRVLENSREIEELGSASSASVYDPAENI